MPKIDRERINRINERLGGGKVICSTCGATLDNCPEKCTAPLDERCEGFNAIEEAGKP